MTANNVRRKKTEKNFKQKLRGRTFLWVAIIYNTDLYSTYVYLFFYLSMKKESLICILHIGQGDFALPTPLVVRPLKKNMSSLIYAMNFFCF